MLVSAAGTPVMESACRQTPGTMDVQVVCLCNEATIKRRRWTEGARPCRRHSNQAPAGVFYSSVCLCDGAIMQAPPDRASLRLLHGARWRRIKSACLSLPQALQSDTCRYLCLGNGAAMQAPPEQASLRLVHGARLRRTEGACSSLPQALQPGTCRCACLCDGAAMQAPPDRASLQLRP